jgi:hypothetical protein
MIPFVRPNTSFLLVRAVFAFALLGTVRSIAFQLAEKSGAVSVEQTTADQQTCQTGADARAQVDLSGGTVIRLGANSSLSSGGSGTPAELLKGTALFDFGKRGQSLLLQHAGKQLTVNSGTGFARFARNEPGQGEVLLIGSIAGKVTVMIDRQPRRLRPGELLAFDAQAELINTDFDLAKLTGSASLLTDFQSSLPGQAAIQREARNFVSLQKRGFIRSNRGANTEQELAGSLPSPTDAGLLSVVAPDLSSLSVNSTLPLGGSSMVGFGSVGSFFQFMVRRAPHEPIVDGHHPDCDPHHPGGGGHLDCGAASGGGGFAVNLGNRSPSAPRP